MRKVEEIISDLEPKAGKTEKNIRVLLSFLDATGGRKVEPDFDEQGQPLTRVGASLSSLKGGIELKRTPIRVARRMAQGILTDDWSVKY